MKTCACGNVFKPKVNNQFCCSHACLNAFNQLKAKTETFTKDDLKSLKLEYRENFEKLLDAFGTEEHQKYVLIERKLNSRENLMRGLLGVSNV